MAQFGHATCDRMRQNGERGGDVERDHTPEDERRIREAALDRTLEATFPASDAPSTLPNPYDDEALRDETQVTTGLPPVGKQSKPA